MTDEKLSIRLVISKGHRDLFKAIALHEEESMVDILRRFIEEKGRELIGDIEVTVDGEKDTGKFFPTTAMMAEILLDMIAAQKAAQEIMEQEALKRTIELRDKRRALLIERALELEAVPA